MTDAEGVEDGRIQMVNSNIVACAFEFVYPRLLTVMQRNKQSPSSTITAGLSRNTDILIRNGDWTRLAAVKGCYYVHIAVKLSVLSLFPVRLSVDRLGGGLWVWLDPFIPKRWLGSQLSLTRGCIL